MERNLSTFEIRPGEAIGPFRLGMTRDQVLEIAQHELGVDVRACNTGVAADREEIGDTGLLVDYDESGCCKRVWARWGYAHRNDSAFTLFGNDITLMDDVDVIKLCKELWPDVAIVYTGIEVPSAGFSATYWDNFTDGRFCAADVTPRTSERNERPEQFVVVQTPLTHRLR